MKRINRILLVDDDEPTNFLNKHIINKYELAEEIVVKHNGAQALEYLTTAVDGKYPTPDIILLDINMPVMDGYGFMQQYESLIPNLAKKITVYILSSSVDLVDFDKTKKINQVTDYIVKPIRDNQLTRILAEL